MLLRIAIATPYPTSTSYLISHSLSILLGMGCLTSLLITIVQALLASDLNVYITVNIFYHNLFVKTVLNFGYFFEALGVGVFVVGGTSCRT